MAKTINCPYCGKLTDPKLDACPHCGGFVRDRAGGGASASGTGAQHACPTCNAVVQEGDIVCVSCGTNLLTGQKIADQKRAPRQRSVSMGLRGFYLAAGVLVAVALLGGGVYGAYSLFRDPVTQANRLVEAGRISEANRMLDEYVAANPDNARALAALGRVQWQTRQYSSAANTFENLMDVDPRDDKAGPMALLALRALDDPAHQDREIEVLRKHLERFPEDAEAWYLAALAKGAAGDTAGQIESLNRAIRLGLDRAEPRSAMGIGYAMQGQHRQAAESVRRAMEANPGDAEVQAAMGFIAQMQGNNADAIQHFQQALELGTGIDEQVRTQLGVLLVAEGRYGDAIRYLDPVVERTTAAPAARFFHALAAFAQGRTSDALSAFERMMGEDHDFAQHAAVQAAQIHLDRGQTSQARDAIDRATRTVGDSAALLTLRGRIHALNNDDNEARELFRRAVQMDGNYAPARLEHGLLLIRRRATGEGIRELERYVDLVDPDLPNARVAQVEALIEQLRSAGVSGETRQAGAFSTAGRS